MRTILSSAVMLALSAFCLSRCLSGELGGDKPQRDGPTVVCHLAYDSFTGAKPESEQREVRVNLQNAGQGLKLGDVTRFKDMAFSTRYAEDYLAIDVLDLKTDKAICRHVYQFGKDVKNQFVGDHGFSGLIHVFHPQSGAELQFFCTVFEK